MLAELVTLSHHHKDSFYTVVSKIAGIDMVGILLFSRAVHKLTHVSN